MKTMFPYFFYLIHNLIELNDYMYIFRSILEAQTLPKKVADNYAESNGSGSMHSLELITDKIHPLNAL